MLLGHIDLVDRHAVRGWAADTDRSFEAVDVAVFVDGRLVGMQRADRTRDDLRDTAALGSGRHGIAYTFEPDLPADQDHDVVVRFADSGKLLGQWHLPRESGRDGPTTLPIPDQEVESENGSAGSDGLGLVGFLDVCRADEVSGWAAREDRPGDIVEISIFVNGSKIAQIRCDQPREDLAAAGRYGEGTHGFTYAFDPPLPTNTLARVSVRFALTHVALPNGEHWLIERQQPSGAGAVAIGSNVPDPWRSSRFVVARKARFVGYVDTISRDSVTGWAADCDRPGRAIDVLLFVNGQRMARIRCDQARSDLTERRLWAGGAHGFKFSFVPRLQDNLDLRICVRFVDSGELLTRGERDIVAAPSEFRLKPILVTAPGRSGTTMLMERLGHCKDVVVANCHPYEVRMLSYYATAFNVLTSPADLSRSTHPDRLEGDGFFVGFNPFSEEGYKAAFVQKGLHEEFYANFIPNEVLSSFRNIVLEYYLRNRDEHGKETATFFAEKNNNLDLLPRNFTRRMFPEIKEIVLVRDPRDLYCSRLAYFKNVPPPKLAQQVRWACTQLRKIHQDATPDMIFVRYEDIVLGRADELRRLSDFLGFELYPIDTSTEQESRFGQHATSASPALSVSRWRKQLSAEEISAFEESGSEFFELFGYETAAMVLAATTTVSTPGHSMVTDTHQDPTAETLLAPTEDGARSGGEGTDEGARIPATDGAVGADGGAGVAAASQGEDVRDPNDVAPKAGEPRPA